MDSKQTMPAILLELRTAKGVTQEEAASHLGVSNKTVSKWETGASLPETEYLTGIADYYGVPVSRLFGRQEACSADELIRQQYQGLSKADAITKSFQMAYSVICGYIGTIWNKGDDTVAPDPTRIFGALREEYFNRSLAASNEAFELLLNNKTANMAVMLTGNEDNFNWLTENAHGYLPLIEFLSCLDTIKIIKLMHSQSFPEQFTADFIAKTAEIDEGKAAEILEKAQSFGLCHAEEMHLKEGPVKLYNAGGNGYILAALSLIHEWACGIQYHDYAYHGSVKLIKGGGPQ